MDKIFVTNILVQIFILGFALLHDWDPYLLFFVYVSELIFSALIGIGNSVRFGGIRQLPISAFTGSVVIGMALGLIFAIANIFEPFGTANVTGDFISILLTSISLTWFTLIINSITVLLAARKEAGNIDPFFYPLKSLVRLIPLFFVVVFGGFIVILGFPNAVIIGMATAHIIVDILLHRRKTQFA